MIVGADVTVQLQRIIQIEKARQASNSFDLCCYSILTVYNNNRYYSQSGVIARRCVTTKELPACSMDHQELERRSQQKLSVSRLESH